MKSFLNSLVSLIVFGAIVILLVNGEVELSLNFKNINFQLTLHLDKIAVTLFLALGLIKALSGLRDAVVSARVHTTDGTEKYKFAADPAEDLRVQGQAFTGQKGLMDKKGWATSSGQINSLQGTLNTEFFNIFMLRKEGVVEFWTGVSKPESRKAPFSMMKIMSSLVQFTLIIVIFLVPEEVRSYIDTVLVAGAVMGLIQCLRPCLVNFAIDHVDSGKRLGESKFNDSAVKPVRAKAMGQAGQLGKRTSASYSDERGWLKGLCKTSVHKEFSWTSLRTVSTIVFHVRPEAADNKKDANKNKKKK